MKLYRNWGAVEDIIDAALAQAEPLTRQHQIRVSVEDELPTVRVDSRAVAEVIYTLVDNASKYAPPETLITIDAHRVADDVIEIAVEDQGTGIASHLRERVFERFYRVTSNGRADGPTGGIGMGLAIARGIVEAHSGRIWIENARNGHGARIVFTVPVGDEDVARGNEGGPERTAIIDESERENSNSNGE
jgi:two-component system sensor histidine kinase KdpD